MSTFKEAQAEIAKEITIALANQLRVIPASAQSQEQIERSNAFIRTETCKLYEDVFNTVKRLMEE